MIAVTGANGFVGRAMVELLRSRGEAVKALVRKQWADYQEAYEALLGATSTPWAPWTVVPADSKTHRNLMIATIVRDTLQGLKLRYPSGDPALAGLQVK